MNFITLLLALIMFYLGMLLASGLGLTIIQTLGPVYWIRDLIKRLTERTNNDGNGK